MFRSSYLYVLYRSHPFVWMNILAFLLLAMVRAVEIVLVTSSHGDLALSAGLIIPMIVYDAVFYFLFVLCIMPIYFLVQHSSQRAASVMHIVLIFLLVFISLGTAFYFSTTLVPLSVDLFGYSADDILETVASSGAADLGTFVLVILAIGLISLIPLISKKLPMPKWIADLFYGAALLSIPLTLIVPKESSQFSSETEFMFARNKSEYLIGKSLNYAVEKIFRLESSFAKEYPFLRPYEQNDVLGPFFNVNKTPPNIVVIIVEGLGSSFMNESYYGGFLPFIDSLSGQSLYWKNFLSTTGRTFGVLPSLFGSLPFGENGFMELGPAMPDHQTLISLLKQNGYYTSYYYGGKSSFDMQDLFLEYQKIDKIVDDKSFPESYKMGEESENGFSWGYSDRDLFKRSIEIIEEHDKSPRLDIYLTLSTHEPFIPPDKDYYRNRFQERLKELAPGEERRVSFLRYENIFTSFLYADDAIRYFITRYSKRPDYQNTIFCITGDHRLIPIPMDSKIDRFRVPFILFSPMVKEKRIFSSISTHSNVAPSLTSFLGNQFAFKIPKFIHWIGDGLDTATGFRNIHSQPLMRNKNELDDYLDGKYFYTEGKLFEMTERLGIDEIENDSVKQLLLEKLHGFKQMNDYVCSKNKLYPYRLNVKLVADKVDYESVYNSLNISGLNSDAQFNMARNYAFDGKFIEARSICKKLLAVSPDYLDVRTLLGRTYSWDHEYDIARDIFNDVIMRAPEYADGHLALAQVEYWSANSESALASVNKALEIDSANIGSRYLKSKILSSMELYSDAISEVDRILRINPSYQLAIDLKKDLQSKR